MQLDKLCKLAGIDRLGAWDYAVPMHWMMEDPENRRENVWFYPSGKKPGRTFGRPLKWKTIGRLALRMMRAAGIPELDEWLRVWAFVHPGRTIDRDGIEAVKRFIENSSDSMRFHIGAIISHYEIPAPPHGTFAEAPRQAA